MPRHFPVPSSQPHRRTRSAFTLIELLVVIGIVVILTAITIPAIKALTKGNSTVQATNLIRTYLATARSIAISQQREAGVIFFEETPGNITPANPNQTAMQLIVQDRNQTAYTTAAGNPPNVGFVYYSRERQYLPQDIQVATLNDDPTKTTNTGGESTNIARVILFNAQGQMVLQTHLARPLLTGTQYGGYPKAYGDWNLSPAGTSNSQGASSPGLLVFNLHDYKQQNFASTTAGQKAASQWIQSNADLIVVNAYTGGELR